LFFLITIIFYKELLKAEACEGDRFFLCDFCWLFAEKGLTLQAKVCQLKSE